MFDGEMLVLTVSQSAMEVAATLLAKQKFH